MMGNVTFIQIWGERAGGGGLGLVKRQAAQWPLAGSPPHHRWFLSLGSFVLGKVGSFQDRSPGLKGLPSSHERGQKGHSQKVRGKILFFPLWRRTQPLTSDMMTM